MRPYGDASETHPVTTQGGKSKAQSIIVPEPASDHQPATRLDSFARPNKTNKLTSIKYVIGCGPTQIFQFLFFFRNARASLPKAEVRFWVSWRLQALRRSDLTMIENQTKYLHTINAGNMRTPEITVLSFIVATLFFCSAGLYGVRSVLLEIHISLPVQRGYWNADIGCLLLTFAS